MLHALYTGRLTLGRRLEAMVEPTLDAPELTAHNQAFWYCWLGHLSAVFDAPEQGHVAFSKAKEIAEREGFGYVLTSGHSPSSGGWRKHGDISPSRRDWCRRPAPPATTLF